MFDTIPGRRFGALVAALALLVVGGCGNSGASEGDEVTLTIYTDQHATLIEALTGAYTEKTGVAFKIQQDATVGQVEAEGKASPADVFLSEDPGTTAQLGRLGLVEPLDASVTDQVRPGYSDPDGAWVAYAARSRVLYYNPEVIDEADLPRTLLDIVDDKYKGAFAYAPSGAFVATTQYLISEIGEEATADFLKKLKKNGVNELKNGNVRDTVEAGKHGMGLSNHYYWWIKAAEVGGPENMTSQIYHFPTTDPGNLVLASGAAVLKNSEHAAAAADFIAWLTSADGGQAIIATGDIDVAGAQYPVAVGTVSDLVGDIDDVDSPEYDMSIFADQSGAEELLKTLGISR